MFNKYVYYKYGERGKPEYPEKTSRSMVEIQQTKPTYDVESGNPPPGQCTLPDPISFYQMKIFHFFKIFLLTPVFAQIFSLSMDIDLLVCFFFLYYMSFSTKINQYYVNYRVTGNN